MKKGVDSYSVKVGCDMVSFTGYKKVILKSDGEAAITTLANRIKASCDLDMGVEASPVGDSKANGEIERAIRTVQGQVRTLQSALDANYRTEF
eukprot:9055848-Pyramimonas_sp.AAC.1